ncbi:hypothetical protein PV325_007139 [Microctonus aethiopoides]|nr:hypothetical protein PV325_007139 [Microctonus aethiopoides]KAK0094830.1 hypothetical protein PV326_009880 [Microctonus aethiopoides]
MDDDKSVKIIRAETSAKTLTEKMNPSMKEEKGALRQSRCTEEKRQMNGLRRLRDSQIALKKALIIDRTENQGIEKELTPLNLQFCRPLNAFSVLSNYTRKFSSFSSFSVPGFRLGSGRLGLLEARKYRFGDPMEFLNSTTR